MEDNSPGMTYAKSVEQGAGLLRDLLAAGMPMVEAGFFVARQSTASGFEISRKAIQVSAELAGVPGSLDLIDSVVGTAQEIADRSIGLSAEITKGSMKATDLLLDLSGIETGEIIRRLSDYVESHRGGEGFETREAMLGVAKLLGELSPLLEASPLELIRGAYSLTEIHREQRLERLKDAQAVDPFTLPSRQVQDIKRFIRFAVAIYGYQALHFLGAFFEDREVSLLEITSDEVALEVLTQVKEKDILRYEREGRMYRPAHFVVLDHESKSVVVAIRGTMSGHDVLVDLVCHQEEFQWVDVTGKTITGKTHKGFLLSAKYLASELHQLVSEALTDNKDYKLRIVGHSLGAGVATLLSLLWAPIPLFASRDIHAFAYAAPCSLCHEIAQAESTLSRVTSVVIGDDLVSRLSLSSFKDLQRSLIAVAPGYFPEEKVALFKGVKREKPEEKLFVGGIVLHLNSEEYGLEPQLVDPVTSLHYIELSGNFLSVHTPETYLVEVLKLTVPSHQETLENE